MSENKYKIQIEYITGDSYGHSEETSCLEFEWTDKTIAKENVRRIKEHDDFCSTGDYGEAKFDRKTIDKLVKSIRTSGQTFMDVKRKLTKKYAKDKPWYIADCGTWCDYSLKLIAPDGKEYTQQAFWHGYHDCLIDVHIEEDFL